MKLFDLQHPSSISDEGLKCLTNVEDLTIWDGPLGMDTLSFSGNCFPLLKSLKKLRLMHLKPRTYDKINPQFFADSNIESISTLVKCDEDLKYFRMKKKIEIRF